MKNTKTEKKKTDRDLSKTYSIAEASTFVSSLSTSKFVGSIDLDIVLNVKEKNKKEVVRGSINFPFQLGTDKKVIVICEEKDKAKAQKAGALKAGPELIEEIEKGFLDFDILITTPSMMPKMVKLGKALGPKGLMPNPKNGTVTDDLEKAISSFKSGKVNFKSAQDQNVIRLKVAKVNMQPSEIEANVLEAIKAVFNEAKRLNVNPFKKITLSPTMGSGVKLDINAIMKGI